MITARRSGPDIHTLDRALQQTKAELETLRVMINARSVSRPRQGPKGSGKLFASTARGRFQARAPMRDLDFLEQTSSNRFMISAIEDLELTEAFWFPDGNKALSVAGYSYIRIYEHDPGSGKLVNEGRLLGNIEGRAKTVGEQCTGPLRRGYCYRFRLEEQAVCAKCNVVALETATTIAVAQWPPGSVILCYRWLS